MLAAQGYLRFLGVQTLLIPATLGLSFFSLFGRREFDLDLKAFGLLVVSDAAAPFIGNWFWGKWADRIGNRWVLAVSAAVSLVAPIVAVIASLAGRGWPHVLVLGAFAAIVFTLGLANAGVDLATKNFILDLAPDDERRTVYIGVNDTFVGIPTILLVMGGAVIDRFGFLPIFLGIAGCSLGAIGLAFLLPSGRSS
jgi:MFS family permease